MEAHDHARTQLLRLRPGVWRALVGGGPEGNEELTTIAGAILIVLLAVLGITIIRIGQLLWLHLPPEPILRAIAPIVVASTIMVFVTGIVLLAVGGRGRGMLVELHKVSFIVWLAFTALHVLLHLPALARWLRVPGSRGWVRVAGSRIDGRGTPAGATGRWLMLGGGLAVGLIIAVALIPDFGTWTAHTAALHHHH